MSLSEWLKSGSVKVTKPSTPGLPDPTECTSTSQKEKITIQIANDAVDTVVNGSNPRKRKRGQYNNYDEEARAKIARYSIESGVARAARNFLQILDGRLAKLLFAVCEIATSN